MVDSYSWTRLLYVVQGSGLDAIQDPFYILLTEPISAIIDTSWPSPKKGLFINNRSGDIEADIKHITPNLGHKLT